MGRLLLPLFSTTSPVIGMRTSLDFEKGRNFVFNVRCSEKMAERAVGAEYALETGSSDYI
eukprot:14960318-Heterocapsa_arctica.AAC.1